MQRDTGKHATAFGVYDGGAEEGHGGAGTFPSASNETYFPVIF
jgi:hypothetical protein